MSIMKFQLDKKASSIIKVLGVGGGGGNAVNYMYRQGIMGVDFAICNTDSQVLDASPIPVKIQLGPDLTGGNGAGNKPHVGREACLESIEDVKEFLSDGTKMLFITAGMGGGTGTGAAPVIAQAAQEMGILTVAIVTLPFSIEGKQRINQGMEGLAELKKYVDSIVVISNDKLRKEYGSLTMSQAFANADTILSTSAKGIAEIITRPGMINVDFEDVNTVMRGSGACVMGTAAAEGPDRAERAVSAALLSPLLVDSDIRGAQKVLLNITSGRMEMTMDEFALITEYLREQTMLEESNLLWGHGFDDELGDKISVTLIATGFESGRKSVPPTLQPSTQTRYPQDERPVMPEKPKVTRVNLDEMPPVSQPTRPNVQPNVTPPDHGRRNNDGPLTIDFDASTGNRPAYGQTPNTQYREQPSYQQPNGFQPPIVEEPFVRTETPSSQLPQDSSRRDRLRRMSFLNGNGEMNPNIINDLENEPAYLRKGLRLDDSPPQTPTPLSRWAVGEDDEDGRPKLSDSNPFLNDNVD